MGELMDHSFIAARKNTLQQSFNDLSSLQNIRSLAKDDINAGLKEVSQQFESMFIQMMLKSMRSANDVFAKDNPLNSSESRLYRDMYDQELSLSLSGKSLGIAEALYRQLSRSYGNAEAHTKQAITEQPSQKILKRSTAFAPFNAVSIPADAHNPSSYKPSMSTNTPSESIRSQAFEPLSIQEQFIQKLAPYAKKIGAKLGVDYRVLIAQSALETGWGRHVIHDQQGNNSFNLFNIKADKRWEGGAVAVPTMEFRNGVMQKEVASFRRYASIGESFLDYYQFLQQPRYKHALSQAGNMSAFVKSLQDAGYATDPEYAKKIGRIISDNFNQ